MVQVVVPDLQGHDGPAGGTAAVQEVVEQAEQVLAVGQTRHLRDLRDH